MVRSRGSGCVTCRHARIRRVKCDEGKPSCQRCLSTGRNCDGYLPTTSNISRRDLAALAQESSLGERLVLTRRPAQAPASLSPSPLGSARSSPQPRECQLFDLFRSATGPATETLAPSSFWTRDILQLAHVEPAVWHAVVALGGLHCRWHDDTAKALSLTPPPVHEVELHYHHAVTLAQRMQQPERALALSLALGAVANLMGSLRESRVHVAAGRNLLCRLGKTDEVRGMAEIVARMDFEAFSFGEATAPYELQDPALLRYDVPRNLVITSYEQAISSLLRMLRVVMMSDEGLPTEINGIAMDGRFEVDLRAWERAMGNFEGGVDISSHEMSALSVRFYHALVRLGITFVHPGPETRFDAQLDLFSRLLVLAEALEQRMGSSIQTMTMEPGLVMALFLIGSRCRHPVVRWRSARLLLKLNRQEGLWRSDAFGAGLKRIIEVEEEEMQRLSGGEDERPHSLSANTLTNLDDGNDIDDRLRASIAVQWTAWADPRFALPSLETWNGVAIIPEEGRIRAFVPTISVEDRVVSATFFMSHGIAPSPHLIPRVREEKCRF
ncbi:uncharacterized protein E0L32_005308 [Thyridium curvatum]|uniref:Zn(2)-C6 fungal-type domain-containing protein n=1 Tax=Thyridium curvatum TaxID=1093900 RepID=A0A507B691_9PEZI|nr:uncharacterized protein E0L32_005308 [Thyridium curvatum]TPX14616.1 hypothetical protein E0L32_005308 [Thyridium curvatum]